MSQNGMERGGTNLTLIKTLTYLMFMMFAMTTDSVGLIIPEIIKAFSLSMTAAGTFQYATMGGIALAGFFLGSLADRLGRKPPILIGLTAFAIAPPAMPLMGAVRIGCSIPSKRVSAVSMRDMVASLCCSNRCLRSTAIVFWESDGPFTCDPWAH